jgi:hypothetical protein
MSGDIVAFRRWLGRADQIVDAALLLLDYANMPARSVGGLLGFAHFFFRTVIESWDEVRRVSLAR